LLSSWGEIQGNAKTVELNSAQEWVQGQLDDGEYDEIDDAIAQYLKDGHSAAYAAAMGEDADLEDDEGDDEEGGGKSRLGKLLDTVEDIRGSLIGGLAIAVGTALLSDNPEQNIQAAYDERASVFATVELTAATTAGTLDSAERQGLAFVRIEATPECEFCEGYTGRILALDDDDGMPPLHNGCQCDIEPLD
jgi:hypothetical protein